MPTSGSKLTIESGSGSASAFPFTGRQPAPRLSETVLSLPRRADDEARGDSTPSALSPLPLSPLAARLFPSQAIPDAPEDLAGVTLGHFRVERRIGMGGMGTVFLAQDERLQRSVALKILAPAQLSDPASIQRFQNEARSAARLDHDHVARVYYYGEEQGVHFIAFEYVQGNNLRDIIRARGRLEPAEAVSYAVQLATALCHTSACGVVHRDIKPSNIIITPQGKAKLVDLGLARKESLETSAHLTVAGTTLGTFDYIAPEQAKDPRSVDVRSDIYALGGTLYHMLTGELPYPEGTVLQRLLDHQDKEAPDPSLRNRRVPQALSVIVRKMLAADLRKRYATAEDLLRDLLLMASALGLQPVPGDSAVMAAWGPRRENFWQQHGATFTAVVILLIAVGVLQTYPDLVQRYTGESPHASNDVVDWREAPTTPDTAPRFVPETNPASPPLSASATDPVVSSPVIGPKKSPETDAATKPADAILATTNEGSRGSGNPKVPTGIFDNELLSMKPDLLSGSPRPVIEFLPMPTVPSPFVMEDSARNETRGNSTGITGTDPTRPIDVPVETASYFQVLGTGKSYATLEAACAEAKDQAVIELQFDGRLATSERPLRLRQKRLVIQAAKGRQPILTFAPQGGVADPSLTRMISVFGGTLSLINVGLELKIPDNPGSHPWALFSLTRPERLKLQGVTATLLNPRSAQATFIEFLPPPSEAMAKMGAMKEGSAALTTDVFIERSFLRGEGVGLALKDSAALRCEISQSMFAVSEWLVSTDGGAQTMQTPGGIALEFNRSTFLLGSGLVSLAGAEELTGRPSTLAITARQSLFSCPPDRPLLDQQVPVEIMEFRKAVTWVDEANVFDDLQTFWSVRSSVGTASPQRWDFLAWKSHWGAGEDSRNLPIPWRQPWRRQPWSQLTKYDARFDPLPENLAAPIEPPGASLESLPPEPTVSIPAL
ncbi:MAG TPA: serine/threonine-protein kinase [Planctomycetaceae bacterium]|nr:serine/threonine-protein kinase [Planctomycetaceae bacterium]